jgi:hypothetical protein
MQRVAGRETEAIRAIEQVKKLSHELRRSLMLCIPLVSEKQVVGADQVQAGLFTSKWTR